MIYCDTSFLFSLYVEDQGSAIASEQISGAKEPLVWTAWHQLEFTNALEARVGRKANSRSEADAVRTSLRSHIEQPGFFSRRSVSWELAITRAYDLSLKWGANFNCRSLDVLHVGICLELKIENFWSLDERQRKLAEAVGLKINSIPFL